MGNDEDPRESRIPLCSEEVPHKDTIPANSSGGRNLLRCKYNIISFHYERELPRAVCVLCTVL